MLRQYPSVIPYPSNVQCRMCHPWAARCRLFGQSLIAVLLTVSAIAAGAVDLPAPDELEKQGGARPLSLTVIEPHVSVDGKPVRVTYYGFPVDALLTQWFGDRWRTPAAEIVFEAADGYRSVIGGSMLSSHRALLATKRADGLPFEVDNPAQHQQRVPLGPYYLVWDNLENAQLQARGTQGWPYQIVRILLQDATDDVRLIPAGASEHARSGLGATKDHCLSCHRIRGVGGDKFPVPLEQTLCRWSDADLGAFIAEPGRFRPGSAMPGLDIREDSTVRADMIGRIVSYLAALRAADSACPGAAIPAAN